MLHGIQGVSISNIDVDFIRCYAHKILDTTTVKYLQNIQLQGSLFQDNPEPGVISSVYTEFYVDHREPLLALEKFKKMDRWCLGELLDGHEYLVVLPVETEQCPSAMFI